MSLEQGRRLQEEGQQLALDAAQVDGGPSRELDRLKWALWRVAHRQEYLTADDVMEEYQRTEGGSLPPRRKSLMGACFRRAREAKVIERTGRSVQSHRTATRARRIEVWRSLKWKP